MDSTVPVERARVSGASGRTVRGLTRGTTRQPAHSSARPGVSSVDVAGPHHRGPAPSKGLAASRAGACEPDRQAEATMLYSWVGRPLLELAYVALGMFF